MKRVGPALYVHKTAVDELPPTARQVVESLPSGWTVARADMRRGAPAGVMLGWTTSWEKYEHPALLRSQVYRPNDEGVWVPGSMRRFNPSTAPIYHRKESMVGKSHPQRAQFAALTAQEAAAGLLGRRDIGREHEWAVALAKAGFRIEDHKLIPVPSPSRVASRRIAQ